MKVKNDLLTALDKELVSVLVFLDLSAAFDTIDHCIILQSLELFIELFSASFSPIYQISFSSLCSFTINLPCTQNYSLTSQGSVQPEY